MTQSIREIGKKNAFTSSAGHGLTRRDGLLSRVLRGMLAFGYFRQIEQAVPAGGTILDFGCGGGNGWIAGRYRATGLESSPDSAAACAKLYEQVVNADICHTPFADASFDGACSKFVLEHLPMEAARETMAEVFRVLKPGGCFVALCDLDCANPQLNWVRRNYPDTYHRLYVLDPGHVGLRTGAEWRAIAGEVGFEVVRWDERSRLPVLDHHPVGQLGKAPELPWVVRTAGACVRRLTNVRVLGNLSTLSYAVVETPLGRLFPRRWAYRLVFTVRKPLTA